MPLQRVVKRLLLDLRKSSSQLAFDGAHATKPYNQRHLSTVSPAKESLAVTSPVTRDRDLGNGADKEPLGPKDLHIDHPKVPQPSGEQYGKLVDNPWKVTGRGQHTSTLSTDIDTAAYANARRYLQQWQQLPPADVVRVEEFINAFDYDYPQPDSTESFALFPEMSVAPWNSEHRILKVGIQGKSITAENRPPATLVFLLDVSGSMNSQNKLPLLKKTFGILVDQLNEHDTVAIVTYAGQAGVALPPTPGNERQKIMKAINGLGAGGSTAGAAGITEAYRLAKEHMKDGGQTRVILGTDGDFNVGMTNQDQLVELIRKEAKDGIFLNVLGFGDGNYQDERMEKISNDGNGMYAYIDSIREARKVFLIN